MLTQWKKWQKELKNTNLILVRFSYKGGANNPSIKYKGFLRIFKVVSRLSKCNHMADFWYTSSLTIVLWLGKNVWGQNASKIPNLLLTPTTTSSIMDFLGFSTKNLMSISSKNEFSWGVRHLGNAYWMSLKGFRPKKSKFTYLFFHNIVHKPTQHILNKFA